MDALRKGRPFDRKTQHILRILRSKHHTLNLRTLTGLKQKILDKLRALALARKILINQERYIEKNFVFLSCPSRLFPSKVIYEANTVVQNTLIFEHFEEYCNELLTDSSAFILITENRG